MAMITRSVGSLCTQSSDLPELCVSVRGLITRPVASLCVHTALSCSELPECAGRGPLPVW